MTLKDARVLQAFIQRSGYHCTVPLGRGPDGYQPRIFGARDECTEFATVVDFRRHHAMRLRQRRAVARAARRPQRDRRSPLDRMIDEACGR